MSPPPVPDVHEEVDDRYRRASALDPSRPGEAVRRRVLEHAAQLAAQSGDAPRRLPLRWRPAAMAGTLAAAVVAGLMIAPRFLVSPLPPQRAAAPSLASGPSASSAPALEKAPLTPEEEPAPPPASPRAAPSMEERRDAYSPTPIASPATADADRVAADAGAADAAAAANTAGTSVAAEQVTATAARRAALAPPAAKNVTDATAAFRQAAETGDLASLDGLLAMQPDINARDAAGRTPLMLAVQHGQTDVVSALLAYGADPNAADSHGTSPLQAARAAGRAAIVAALQRYGAR